MVRGVEEGKLCRLIEEMVRLLITYEIELTSYQTVYDAVSVQLAQAGADIDIRKMVKIVAQSASLQAQAEAEYAALLGLAREITPDAVDGSLRSIRHTIDNRDNQSR